MQLRSHLRKKHPIDGQKQWIQMVNTVCQKCDKTFKTPEGLDAHRQEIHTIFKCDICNLGLTSAVALSSHRNWHSSKARNFKCDVREDFVLVNSFFFNCLIWFYRYVQHHILLLNI